MKYHKLLTVLLLLLTSFFYGISSVKSADIVYRKSESRRLSGSISKISNTEIVLQSVAKNKPATHIPANDIKEIKWNNEPAGLTLLRSAERKNSLDKALKGYKKEYESIESSQKNLRVDLSYLIARTTAKLAMNDDKYIKEAIKLLDKFRKSNSNHYRYYESLVFLNKLYQKQDNSEQVQIISELISKAPWKEFKDSGNIEKAYGLLKTNQMAKAAIIFDKIIHEYEKEPENGQLLIAQLGKSVCYIRSKEYDKAEESINHILDHAKPNSKILLSETYLVQGELYRSLKRPKDAILAYLHNDLIFNKERKTHAESLYWLSVLWKQLGNETRSLKNKEKLKSKYSKSIWSSKLK